MSRVKDFFQGRVDFVVDNLPLGCLNKLRHFHLSRVKIRDTHLFFSVPLTQAPTVKKLVSNFDWQMVENHNVWRGINFLLNHFVLVLTLLAAFAAFLVLDGGIYTVKVLTPDNVTTEAVYPYLQELGVKKFMRKRQVSELDLANNLVAAFPDVAHANVRIAGNTLLIQLATATQQAEPVKVNYYARHDAVIKEVIATSGQVQVEPGDVVRCGDLLVSDAYANSVAVIGEVAFVTPTGSVRLAISII